MRAIQRHAGTLSIVVALAVLQAPLCALACLESNAAAEVTEAAPPPCHGEPSTPATENEPPEPYLDCGCASTTAAVGPKDSTLDSLHSVGSSFAQLPWAAVRPPKIAHTYEVELPPPDLLLRKSTLIL